VKLGSRVGVVIPTRNRPQLAKRAVESALAQTHRELDVVVVIDGPDDATQQILTAICDKRLTVTVTPQRGASAARNIGVRMLSTDWIAFLDDDDIWQPTKLETQLRAATLSTASTLVLSCLSYRTSASSTRTRAGFRVPVSPIRTLAFQGLHPNVNPPGATNPCAFAALRRGTAASRRLGLDVTSRAAFRRSIGSAAGCSCHRRSKLAARPAKHVHRLAVLTRLDQAKENSRNRSRLFRLHIERGRRKSCTKPCGSTGALALDESSGPWPTLALTRNDADHLARLS
jgi:glycosyltransferase involved in cell wall biosynthesis